MTGRIRGQRTASKRTVKKPYSLSSTARMGQAEQDSHDRTSGQDGQDRTPRTGLPAQDQIAGHNVEKRGQTEQDSENRTVRMGQPDWDKQNRTDSAGLPGQDCQDRTSHSKN